MRDFLAFFWLLLLAVVAGCGCVLATDDGLSGGRLKHLSYNGMPHAIDHKTDGTVFLNGTFDSEEDEFEVHLFAPFKEKAMLYMTFCGVVNAHDNTSCEQCYTIWRAHDGCFVWPLLVDPMGETAVTTTDEELILNADALDVAIYTTFDARYALIIANFSITTTGRFPFTASFTGDKIRKCGFVWETIIACANTGGTTARKCSRKYTVGFGGLHQSGLERSKSDTTTNSTTEQDPPSVTQTGAEVGMGLVKIASGFFPGVGGLVEAVAQPFIDRMKKETHRTYSATSEVRETISQVDIRTHSTEIETENTVEAPPLTNVELRQLQFVCLGMSYKTEITDVFSDSSQILDEHRKRYPGRQFN